MLGIHGAVKLATRRNLGAAVHRHKAFSRPGLQERVFTLAFRQLVYPQIWEDPVVDLEALRLTQRDRVIAIGPQLQVQQRDMGAVEGLRCEFRPLYGRYAFLATLASN